ncbi:hypothetical protein Pla100_05280 [Neorhodopirellula pilleata]|uniref:Uncharacterized protein n=1 Tax=Neorhodopirellula pilleata TaxID=2714738 RepID=A0A5C6AV41_9BACT|nr:hypothetical protein Pla100_05280 [Neorhodopirellula pilleata]
MVIPQPARRRNEFVVRAVRLNRFQSVVYQRKQRVVNGLVKSCLRIASVTSVDSSVTVDIFIDVELI